MRQQRELGLCRGVVRSVYLGGIPPAWPHEQTKMLCFCSEYCMNTPTGGRAGAARDVHREHVAALAEEVIALEWPARSVRERDTAEALVHPYE